MKNVLFLCTGNSCRSQMAEGLAKQLDLPGINFASAGVIAKGLDPLAIEAMSEIGIDISNQTSNILGEMGDIEFDLVITLCGHAHESCPVFPHRTKVIHHGFDDPPQLARDAETREEKLGHYRPVRDQINSFLASQEFGMHLS
ncbi:MAG: arsenate reductase ArsC [Phycisphaerales bacterium]